MYNNDQTNSVPEEQFGDQYLNSENTGNDKINDRKTIKSSEDSTDKTNLNIEDPEKLPDIDNAINDGEKEIDMYIDKEGDKDKEQSNASLEEDKTEDLKVADDGSGQIKMEDTEKEARQDQEIEEKEDKPQDEVKEPTEDSGKDELTEGKEKEEITEDNGKKKQTKSSEEEKIKEGPVQNEIAESIEKEEITEGGGKEEIAEDTGKEELAKDTGKEEIAEDTGKEEIAKDTGKEEIAKDAEQEKITTSEQINYSLLSKADLIKVMEELISDRPVQEIRFDVEVIKTSFYKKHKSDFEDKRKNFIDEGGKHEDFRPLDDSEELYFRELLKKYRDLRIANTRFIEEEKQENLKQKYQIIEDIKELINSQESINKTFQDFRELQNRWRDIGVVPQVSLNDLWETYHHYVEKFYDYININKELRDLDLRKNLEEKISLCEEAEALLLEPNILNAFNTLQVYHEEWREIGPVPIDKRAEIWERFKEATSKINKKHQLYYQDIKEQQKKNLEQKDALCERVESLLKQRCESHKDWVDVTSEILGIQKTWKTIGFAPKKENNKIYSRFRSACDRFFEKKREFYVQNMREQNDNLQKKMELCMQAETLKDSEDWKATTEELIKLQKKWKQIGPVPRRKSELIWKRFRGACDKFFNRKLTHYKEIDSSYETNLELKENLIKEIKEYKLSDDMKKNLDTLQTFQRRWTEIGFVPLDKKDEIQQRYRDALNKHFDNLQVDDVKKNVLKFGSRIESIIQKPRSGQKLRFEREKYMNKLQQLKSDISVYENNIGFFANNKNSEGLRRDFEKKIADTHTKIKLLEEKINLIDELDLDDE